MDSTRNIRHRSMENKNSLIQPLWEIAIILSSTKFPCVETMSDREFGFITSSDVVKHVTQTVPLAVMSVLQYIIDM